MSACFINRCGFLAVIFFLVATLTACGGDGSKGPISKSSSSRSSSISPPANSTYIISPGKINLSFVAGYPTTFDLVGTQRTSFIGVVYISATTETDLIQSPMEITTNPNGSIAVQLKTLASTPPGHYIGNLTFNVCADSKCTSHVAGSPFAIPYDIEVLSPDGKVTNYNLSPLSAMPAVPDWQTFQANASHTGYVPVTLDATKFNARWKWNTPASGGTPWWLSSIVTANGLFYVAAGGPWIWGTSEQKLHAISEYDADIKWSYSFADLEYPSTNPPAVANDRVYIAAGSQSSTAMFAFDALTGVQLFNSPMGSQWESYLAPTIRDGVVYTNGGVHGGMYAFDEVTGEEKFFTYGPQYDGWTPAVDAAYAYAYVGGGLNIIDILTGEVTGTIADPTYSWNGYTSNCAPVIAGQDSVFAGNLSNTYQNAIANFDTNLKTVRWTASGNFSGNPAYANGVLFAANNLPLALQALNEVDGDVLWSWSPPAGSSNFVSDVLVTNNLAFVSTGTTTYAIDIETQQAVWNYPAAGSLALSANGILYIQSSSTIVAINLH